jgi:imidazolonepropionase-like amidohydrolase
MRIIFYSILLFLTINIYGQKRVNHNYLITDVTIIDVRNGNFLTHQSIGIDSNRISKIYKTEVLSSDSTIVIKGKGKYLIPGLWDMHIHYHWNYKQTTPFLIANGIIGIREMFGDMTNITMIREKEKSETFLGPEIVSSGAMIEGINPTWPSADIVMDSVTAREVVEKQKSQGVDFLKIGNKLNKQSYFAIAKYAKEQHIDFAGHIPVQVSAWDAISQGQKSIEHNIRILEAVAPHLDSLRKNFPSNPYDVIKWKIKLYTYVVDNFNEYQFDSLLHKLSDSNTWLCPTLVVTKGQSYRLDTSFIKDSRRRFVPDYILKQWNGDLDTTLVLVLKRKYDFEYKLLKKMLDNGVKFIAGTDYPNMYTYPGFSLHDELELFYNAGFTSLQALQTATLNPAIYLNKQKDYGTIEESKIASLLLLNSNPLLEITNTRDIEAVFLKGKYISKGEIDSLLRMQVN